MLNEDVHDPAISLPGKYPIAFIRGDTDKIVPSSTVTVHNWKQAKYSLRWINKIVLFSIKYYPVVERNDVKLQATTWWIPGM